MTLHDFGTRSPRILFLLPPNISIENFASPAYNERSIIKGNRAFGSVSTDMPIGILSLSAYIKKYANAETKLYDFNIPLATCHSFHYDSFTVFFNHYLTDNGFCEWNPDAVAISCLFTPSYHNTLFLAATVKLLFPAAKIIGGGSVPTTLYKQIFQDTDCFDALCYGEGEKPLTELILSGFSEAYINKSMQWITKDKAEGNFQPEHDMVVDLDTIPPYDYDLISLLDYATFPSMTAYGSGKKVTNVVLMTSRGCPYRCCFCGSHAVHGRSMRYHSLKRVKEEIYRICNEYHAKAIVFQDDHFLADKERFLAIIDMCKEFGVEVLPQNGLAISCLDTDILDAMRKCGVERLSLPLESGSQRILRDVIHKPLKREAIIPVLEHCRSIDIYTSVNIIIGFHDETARDREDALQFCRTLTPNWFVIFFATPVPGSEMFKICLERGYFKRDPLECSFKWPNIETEHFTQSEIMQEAYELNLQLNFLYNPDMRVGDYTSALLGFTRALRARDDHLFAQYFSAICHEKLGNTEEANRFRQMAARIYQSSSFWRLYADKFLLPPLV